MALAKGMRGRAKNCFRLAIRRVEKGLQYAYKSRRLKRRDARKEQIMQMSAAAREYDLPYSKMVHGLQLASIGLNRKMLSVLAKEEPYSFRAIVDEAKRGLREAVIPNSTPPGTRLPKRVQKKVRDYPLNYEDQLEWGVAPRFPKGPLSAVALEIAAAAKGVTLPSSGAAPSAEGDAAAGAAAPESDAESLAAAMDGLRIDPEASPPPSQPRQ